LNTIWGGYLNPFHAAAKCTECDGTGYSPTARRLSDQWYGNAPFRPEDRGSVPFKPEEPAILDLARRNVTNSPEFYGRDKQAVEREAKRLCHHYNTSWSHHLNDDDVAALLKSERLLDLTHTFTPG